MKTMCGLRQKGIGIGWEYEFLQYEDKGLSGYFSDRLDFQRMLHDVQDGKIKAIVCYKLDRVGRKTADLIRLMDFLEMTKESRSCKEKSIFLLLSVS